MTEALRNLRLCENKQTTESTRNSSMRFASLVLSSDLTQSHSISWLIDRSRVIGRASADIELQVDVLSRQHAKVSLMGEACQIQDLNSRNGTALNGHMLSTEPHILRHGDTIMLAGKVEMRFHDPNATPFAPRLGALRGLWIDPDTDDVWIDANRLIPPLSAKQSILLQLVADANGKLVTRDTIATHVWPNAAPDYINNDAIDSLIKRLRKRLSCLENGYPVLEIVRGRGVRLDRRRINGTNTHRM